MRLFIICFCLICIGCTANQQAKNLGGTATVDLPAKQKFISATWKEANLWYLTRPMHDDEFAETYTFQEQSSFGLIEGKVVFKEKN